MQGAAQEHSFKQATAQLPDTEREGKENCKRNANKPNQ